MKARCRDAGESLRREWVARYATETFSDAPEYSYCDSLKTCLYADDYIDAGNTTVNALLKANSRRDWFIVDVYTNKVLVEYTEHDGQSITDEVDPVMCRTKIEFDERKTRLFNSEGR